MSDQTEDTAEETVEHDQAVEQSDTATPPWGDDFDPAKAWQTITHLRGREKELETSAKQFQRIQDDEDALREFLASKGYEIGEDEDDEEELEDLDPSVDPDIAELKQFKQQLERETYEREVAAVWDGWANYMRAQAKEEAGVELSDWDLKALRADCNTKDGLPVPEAQADKVLKQYVTEALPAKKRPRAPHVVTGGSSPGGGKDPSEMTDQERVASMVARITAEQG